MIVEYTYSQYDLKKKCFGCKWLCMDKDEYGKEDLFLGTCICDFNKIKNRDRCITDKACKCKNYDQSLVL